MVLYGLSAQNPHGEDFAVDCASCHNPTGWSIATDTLHFNHDTTSFPLLGQHNSISCNSCHVSLVFDEAPTQCIDCHLDVHSMSVGNDCARCHNNDNWLVDNIPELHEMEGFPLVGQHQGLFCVDCHLSETQLRFDRIGNDCINCHRSDFEMTVSPDHEKEGFSTDCSACHDLFGNDWSSENFNHSFFPLTLGHDIDDCRACHLTENYSDASPECVSCHLEDFEATMNPDHGKAEISLDCIQCHTTDPGWKPAEFISHDVLYFPIYSGAHEGEWMECIDCHLNPDDFSSFSCVVCHELNETTDEHDEVDGFVFEDNACLACHPTGSEEDNFNHDNTNFPLTGAHINTECTACHMNGFAGTPTDCNACHDLDFQQTVNPDHEELGISNECAQCHTTDPEWMPARFDIHDDYYPLLGAHNLIRNDCAACHNGDYVSTPNDCVGCHLQEYESTTDPNHSAAGFNTDCRLCHNEDSWEPADFDHDNQYFPIYSGAHEGEWGDCVDCHTDPNNYASFQCIGCHINPETDDEHETVPGYVYDDVACLACHPTGDADMVFDHASTGFLLTGGHFEVDCFSCHDDGFEGTSPLCVDCHEDDFMASLNPSHTELNLSTDCISCHTTDPGWRPARFDDHDAFHPLNGAHNIIREDCASCHNGDYINTPNTCVGCHQDDFVATIDPDHEVAQFSTDCMICHNEDAWEPSTFDHDGQYFPIYSGKHMGEWSDCIDCHNVPSDYSQFTCIACHINPETDTEHEDVIGYVYEDNACLGCHPTGDAEIVFNHDDTAFPLTGAHLTTECIDCHINGFEGTSTECQACHTPDFQGSVNPNHINLGLSMDCISCHTTDPGWAPASFDIHDQYYALNGAHAMIAQNCVACHNGDYINTPNECVGCHLDDYNATTNPNHQSAQFNTDCIICHNEDAWQPSTFDHDGQYFPINSGTHMGEWTQCTDCHINSDNYAIFSCIVCHLNPETDLEHPGVGGYLYEDQACLACHPTGEAMGAFDHNTTGFPLTGAHIGVLCLDCHQNGYEGTSSDCASCHDVDYNMAVNPNHNALGIPMDCASCHTTDPGWAPASFDIHDQYYALTGAHAMISNDCVVCHNGDYVNTPNTCDGCHLDDYNTSVNPNHQNLNLPLACDDCHSTDPGWMPASFDIHDQYYPLNGAHALISNDCVLCHNGDYVNTPNTCVGCHLDDFEGTTDPDHEAAQFSNDCIICHNEDAWEPSTFDHDGQYFPIYSGSHDGEWMMCTDCHTNPNDYSIFSCVVCHVNPETDDDHNGIGGYIYEDNACLACHPDGESAGAFDHNSTSFPLTGGHFGLDCLDCHANGYVGTPTDCFACHETDYDNSVNPSHTDLNIPVTCEDCHTTDPGWTPASFDIHDQYYPLTGAHATISNDCVICHNGDYINTPNTCDGCHIDDYNSSTNPDHQALNIPVSCDDCHTTEPGWMPASFDIHDQYYPLTGAHNTIANDCVLCHNGDYVNTPNTCDGCHINDYNGTTNPDHQALNIPVSCDDCHTTEPGWMPATFDIHDQYYALNGAHAIIANDCVVCHNGDYVNTPNTCVGCHQDDYDGSTNPDHGTNNISTDCISCHNEDAWVPSDFNHNDFYMLNGAHANIANDCFACHMGDYVNTPNTCIGCHQSDYDGTTNPDHAAAGFPTDCLACHSEDAWLPVSWDHDGMYFPIYSGKHEGEWSLCIECHTVPNDFSAFSCIDCHEHNNQAEVDDDHSGVSGYVYESNACYACHPTGED